MITKFSFFVKNKLTVITWLIVITIILLTGGYFYYSYLQESIREEKNNQIKSIADLKISQIMQWIDERIGDAETIRKAPLLANAIIRYQKKNKQDKRNFDPLLNRISSYKHAYSYDEIAILTTDGNIIISTGTNPESIHNYTKEKLKEAIQNKKVVLTNFYKCNEYNKIHFDIISPVLDENDKVVAAVLFQIDPEHFLYPFIQTWPTPSKTAETLILKKEGDSAVFLNELKFRKNSALNFKLSLQKKEVTAVQAVLGYEGIFEGKDYRGVEVLSYITPIKSTDWYMVSKVDKSEVFEDLFTKTVILIVFIFVLIALFAMGMFGFYNYNQSNIYKSLWQTQEEYKTTLYSIGDAVITTDSKGKIKYMNPIAEALTGWCEKEARNKNLEKVFDIIDEETRNVIDNPVIKVFKNGSIVGLANHTILISKSGKEIPIADSAAPIKNEKNEIVGVVLVFRDQTKERKARKEISNLNRVYALLSNVNQAIVRLKDKQNLLNEICRIAVDDGKFLMTWIGFVNNSTNKVEVISSAGKVDSFLEDIDIDLSDPIKSNGPTGACILNGVHFFSNNIENDPRMEPWRENALKCGFKSSAAFPLKLFNNTIGAINFYSNQIDFFNEPEIKLLDEMAADVSFALEFFESEREKELFNYSINKSVNEIYIFDADTLHFIYVNEGALINTGYSLEEIKTITPLELKPEFSFDDFQKLTLPLIKKEKSIQHFRTIHKRKNGTTYPVEVNLQLLERGESKVFLAIIQDLTEQLKIEKSLELSEKRFRDLINYMSDTVWVLDFETNIIDVNDAAVKQLGYSKEELLSMKISDIDKNLKPEQIQNLASTLVDEKQQVFQTFHTAKDGRIIPVEVSSNPVSFGEQTLIISIARDITARQKMEKELRESEEKYRRIAENISDVVWVTDLKFNVKYVSQSIRKLTGHSPEEYIKLKMEYKFTPDSLAKINSIFKEEIEKEKNQSIPKDRTRIFEVEHYIPNNATIWISINISFLRNEKGEIYGIIGVSRDITELKIAEEALHRKNESLLSLFEIGRSLSLEHNEEILLQKIVDGAARISKMGSGAIYLLKDNKLILKATYPPLPSLVPEQFLIADIDSHPHIKKAVNTGEPVVINDISDNFLSEQEKEIMIARNLQSLCFIPLVYMGKSIGVLIFGGVENTYKFSKEEIEVYRILAAQATLEIMKTNLLQENMEHVERLQKEIQERIKIEKALTESELRFRKLIEHAPDGIVIIDSNGKFKYASPSALRIFDYENVDYKKLNPDELTHPEDLPMVLTSLKKLIENPGTVITLQYRFKHGNGSWIWIESVFSNLLNEPAIEGIVINFRSIDERKKYEDDLNKRELLYRTLFDLSPSGIMLEDLNGNIIDANETFLETTGYEREELIGQNVKKIVPPEFINQVDEHIVQIKSGKTLNHDVMTLRKDGTRREVELWETMVTLPSGEKGIIVVTNDVTDRKIAERKIIESEKRFRSVVESLNQAYYEADKRGIFIYCNPGFYAIGGYTEEELIGTVSFRIVAEEYRKNVIDAYKKWLSEKKSDVSIEFQAIKKDGSKFWVEQITHIEYDSQGNFVKATNTIRDINERKLAEEALKESEERFRYISSTISDISYSCSFQSEIEFSLTWMTGAAKRITGYSIEELIDLGCWGKIVLEEDYPIFKEKLIDLSPGSSSECELRIYHKNGSIIWLHSFAQCIQRSENPDVKIIYGGLVDITEMKKMIADLTSAKEKAEEMNKVKSFFFANMSHELRTPLIGILGFSEILLDELLDKPEAIEMVKTINRGGQRLLDTLNLILNFSKVEADKTEIVIEEKNIIPLINESFNLYSGTAANKGINLEIFIQEEEIICNIDEGLFTNIINNLISNAIKFTFKGGINVRVNKEEDFAIINVVDTGIGIPEEKLDVIWEEFRQVSEGLSRSFEGTGLGLTIAKKYTELMGGTISVKSEVGIGSTFTVKFPLTSKPEKRKEVIMEEKVISSEQKMKRHKILYVEDDYIAIDVVKRILKDNYELDFATNGEEALEKAENNIYDGILMDINLRKGLDGVMVTERIRKMEKYKDVPIIAITAYAMEEDKAEFLSKGMTHYISKPFKKLELINLMNEIFNK